MKKLSDMLRQVRVTLLWKIQRIIYLFSKKNYYFLTYLK